MFELNLHPEDIIVMNGCKYQIVDVGRALDGASTRNIDFKKTAEPWKKDQIALQLKPLSTHVEEYDIIYGNHRYVVSHHIETASMNKKDILNILPIHAMIGTKHVLVAKRV